MKILMVEDDRDLAEFTKKNLKKHGFVIDQAYSGEEALCFLETEEGYDVAILDLILPDTNGKKLLKKIKSLYPEIPILALTAKGSKADKIEGIKIGFDDYMTKPFSHHELVARLRVLHRLARQPRQKSIKVGRLKIIPDSQKVLVNDKPVKLSLNEFRLLSLLAQHQGQWLSVEKLLELIWDRNSHVNFGKVFTAISRLRKKLGDSRRLIIKTSQKGYKIGQ